MKPLALRLRNYRSFRELDVELPDGLVAITGQNGAGKSSLLGAIDLALFGPEGRSLAPYVSDDADGEMLLELVFEHAGDTYRVRRTFSPSGRGKSATDFDLFIDCDPEENWRSLTRETQDETQAVIEKVLGFNRDTFRASSFLAQGDGAAFCEAPASDRKAILARVLGLDVWDSLLKLTREQERENDKQVAQLNFAIERADKELEDRPRLSALLQDAADICNREADALVAAEASLKTAQQAATAMRDGLQKREAAANRLRAAATALQQQRDAELAVATAEWRARKTSRDHLLHQAARLAGTSADHAQKAKELDGAATASENRAAATTAGQTRCERCGQVVDHMGAQQAQGSYRADADVARRQAKEHRDLAAMQLTEAGRLKADAAAVMVGEEPVVSVVADSPEILEVRAELARLPEVEAPDIHRVQNEAFVAEKRVDAIRARLTVARDAVAKGEARLFVMEQIADQRDADASLLEAANDLAVTLATEAKARGSNGIPLLVIENAVPQIEGEANRILEALGTTYRVELATQVEKKTGGVKDTLDVVVWGDVSARPFETFSGGERTRIALALRISLARLLATRRGAESRLLVIDEPDGLDAAGMDALYRVLAGLQDTFDSIYVISHQRELQDAFATVIRVEKTNGVSRISDREAVTA